MPTLNNLRKQALNLPKTSVNTAKKIVNKFKFPMKPQNTLKGLERLGFAGGKRKTRKTKNSRKQRKTRRHH